MTALSVTATKLLEEQLLTLEHAIEDKQQDIGIARKALRDALEAYEHLQDQRDQVLKDLGHVCPKCGLLLLSAEEVAQGAERHGRCI